VLIGKYTVLSDAYLSVLKALQVRPAAASAVCVSRRHSLSAWCTLLSCFASVFPALKAGLYMSLQCSGKAAECKCVLRDACTQHCSLCMCLC
jgi:hypothetical protein